MDLLIFVEKKSSRIEYIFNHIFNRVLGLSISYTNDVYEFQRTAIPKIEYSKKPFSDALFFHAEDLLFEDDIRTQNIIINHYNNVEVFFSCSNVNSCLPFDPFAASFYMLSRYEEYVSDEKDHLGRFPARSSLAYQNNFLDKVVVDYWILFIKEKINEKFPNLVLKNHTFKFFNTIDVDNAFAYSGKSFIRTVGSLVKDFFRFDFKKITQKANYFSNKIKDPYDTYEYLLNVHDKYNLTTFFFFLLADYGKYDRGVHFSNKKLQNTIKQISNSCSIGIHSSFASIESPNKIQCEIQRLELITNQDVEMNRQHFLSLNIPQNYQNLLKYDIKHDYSMGFPSVVGFRAGTCYDFHFFDLTKNTCTDLLIHPFCIMDVTLKDYMKLNPTQAFNVIKKIVNEVKNVNGNFISIWHNESLDFEGPWLFWDNVYEDMIKYITNERN